MVTTAPQESFGTVGNTLTENKQEDRDVRFGTRGKSKYVLLLSHLIISYTYFWGGQKANIQDLLP